MSDFSVSGFLALPSEGSNLTPAHHYPDFRFKTYAPLAFRYFRDLFGIKPDDYLVRPASPRQTYLKKTKTTVEPVLCWTPGETSVVLCNNKNVIGDLLSITVHAKNMTGTNQH